MKNKNVGKYCKEGGNKLNLYEKISVWEKNEGKDLFKNFELPKEAKVLDYGCGFGHYSLAAANALKDIGIVYAVDVNKMCLDHINRIITSEDIQNLEVQDGNEDWTLNFDDNSIDMILYYDILHGGDGKHKIKLFNEARRVLKTNGLISILPFHLSNFKDNEGKKKNILILNYQLKLKNMDLN